MRWIKPASSPRQRSTAVDPIPTGIISPKAGDIQSVWVENENGDKERELDGKLEAFDLRTKKVDPASLGVDPGVKQYSGYLDDNENDKHLFYCE